MNLKITQEQLVKEFYQNNSNREIEYNKATQKTIILFIRVHLRSSADKKLNLIDTKIKTRQNLTKRQ